MHRLGRPSEVGIGVGIEGDGRRYEPVVLRKLKRAARETEGGPVARALNLVGRPAPRRADVLVQGRHDGVLVAVERGIARGYATVEIVGQVNLLLCRGRRRHGQGHYCCCYLIHLLLLVFSRLCPAVGPARMLSFLCINRNKRVPRCRHTLIPLSVMSLRRGHCHQLAPRSTTFWVVVRPLLWLLTT